MATNRITLTSHTHKLPPKTPVNSYHCIHCGCSEKAFPKFNQGHEKSQFK